ncbi:reverse transcriptase domain-containing protein [Tanacetum coccineum]
MTDNRTMEELLQAPKEGYREVIVIPEINADHFEIKTNLLQLVQANPFCGFERKNPHTHINNFKRITSTLKFRDVPNNVIKLMMFPYSLEGAARVWYDKELPNSILTWDDLVNKFVNQFFPPSKTTHLKSEISRFTQKFDETFSEAWERFKEMLRACPHHGFTELTQIDTFYNGLNENDQDSLNAAAGGNLLSKTTREALNIIENKSKVRYSRSKSNVSRVNTTSRESSSKTDDRIDKLADQISTLVEIVTKKVVTPATVKAVEESCVICGGAHAYYDCIATDSNQSSVCAATGTYNQVAPPNRASNQMAPPGFAPLQNNQNRFNQNQGNNFNRGNNFHGNQGFQAPINHAPNFQNQGFQNQPFQAPNNQVQQGISNEFSSYMKSNDQMMRNMQNQINSLKGEFKNEIQNTIKTQQTLLMNQQNAFQNNLQNMLSGFFQNQASTSGTLPSNTIPNPKGEMKPIITRSGVAYEVPSIPTNPSPKKVMERETEETTDTKQTNFQGSTAHIQPSVIPIPKPDVPKTLPKPNIPYPSRLNDQKLHEKATNQMEKFFQIFQDLHFDISFMDALLLMQKFASTIKSLLTNKDKLFELAKIPLNENCPAMLLKKLPEKIGDPGKFLIPCDFSGMDVCHALADLGASINLMPLSISKKLSLPEFTPTRMTLELADRSITRPKGVTEDVFVKVEKFHFPTDFVVVDFDADPRVPLILRRSFLRTGRALIDVYEREPILRDGDEQLIFHVDKHPQKHTNESINMINFIDVTCKDNFEEVLRLKKSNHPSSGSTTLFFYSRPSLIFFETSDSLLEEFADELALLDPFSPGNEDVDFEADLEEIELLLNHDPSTDFSPKITIDPNPERFINESALVCLPPPGDDDDNKEITIPLNELIPPSLAITSVLPTIEPEDSLIMGDEHLITFPIKEMDGFIKSSVEEIIPIPSESEVTPNNDKGCDLPFYDNNMIFSNPLFGFNDDFTSSDDKSFLEEDVQEENFQIYSNPIFEFDDNYNSSDINPLFNEILEDIENEDSNVSNFDKPVLLNTPLFDEDECFDPGGDIDEIDVFLAINVPSDIIDAYNDSEGDALEILHNTTHNLSPEVFFDHEPQCFKDEPGLDKLKSMVKVFDLGIWENFFSPSYMRLSSKDRHYLSFTIVIQILLTYLVNLLFSFKNEDTIFDPDITALRFLEPVAYEYPVEDCSSTCFVPNITMIWGESSYVTRLPKTKRFVGGTPCLSIFLLSYF